METSHQPMNSSNSSLFENASIRSDSSEHSDQEEKRETPDSKDNVRVFVRIKPISSNQESSIQIESSQELSLYYPNRENIKKFIFEKIFTNRSSADEIFHETTIPLLKHALLGENAVLFVYGPTGTGKTHTMGLLSEINRRSTGIIPLALRYLFNYFAQVDTHYKEKYSW